MVLAQILRDILDPADELRTEDSIGIIMEDILALLNIDVSYNERLSQINKIMNQVEKNFKELNLTVVSTTLYYDQSTYIITPFGLKNSKREAKDGIVLFGYERKNNIKRESENLNTDNNIYSNENGKKIINNNTDLINDRSPRTRCPQKIHIHHIHKYHGRSPFLPLVPLWLRFRLRQ